MNKEKYIFTIGQDVLEGTDILNKSFNATTQDFLLANGLTQGIHVLDLGCGAGTMTRWIAKQIGEQGKVVGIDADHYQVKAGNDKAQHENLLNCHFQALSAYDVHNIKQCVDLVYCRFLLHHLNDPDIVISKIYDLLKPGGIFISEEGICDHGFSYPYSDAFKPAPDNGEMPDKNIGKKLHYKLSQAGFNIHTVRIIQPVLVSKQEKSMLLPGLSAMKESFLPSGKTEKEWHYLQEETQKLVENDKQIVGFYASCQVAGIKL